MIKRRRHKCLHCGQLFRPDPRNARHQRYCSATACRRASKAASQRRWLAKPENSDYFRGPEQVARVRAWRATHPGYWRRGAGMGVALQDDSSTQAVDAKEESGLLAAPAQQDVSATQDLVLTGLIAHLMGATLQEDIARVARRLQQLALDIQREGDGHGAQIRVALGAATPGAESVQLDRSSPGA